MAAAATPTEPTAPAAAPAPIITISYHDLASFHPLEEASHERNQRLMDSIGAAFGADGLGILAVLHVPDFTELRQALLPLAARLPTLPDIDQLVHEESLYSTGWSHGKECLVVPQGDGPNSTKVQPDNAKGSFYANPLTDDLVRACRDRQDKLGSHETLDWEQLGRDHPDFFAPNLWPRQSLPQLEQAFVAMGKAIHATGCLLAGVCDAYCQAQGVTLGLQETLTRSLNAKGRLLHYFAVGATDHGGTDPGTALWCGWHKDHGSLTGLVPAMFLTSQGEELPSCPDPDAGLYIQSRTGEILKASLPPDACGFQIGETSQIQSGGILQATPHAVKPPRQAAITRESFALFLEPEFADPLHIPAGRSIEDVQASNALLPPSILPLSARWKPGQTFGDFHRTTVSAFTVASSGNKG